MKNKSFCTPEISRNFLIRAESNPSNELNEFFELSQPNCPYLKGTNVLQMKKITYPTCITEFSRNCLLKSNPRPVEEEKNIKL